MALWGFGDLWTLGFRRATACPRPEYEIDKHCVYSVVRAKPPENLVPPHSFQTAPLSTFIIV